MYSTGKISRCLTFEPEKMFLSLFLLKVCSVTQGGHTRGSVTTGRRQTPLSKSYFLTNAIKNFSKQRVDSFLCLYLVASGSFPPFRTVAHQTPLSMGFFRQKYRSRLPFPSPGDLPAPGVEHKSPVSPVLQAFFTHGATGEAQTVLLAAPSTRLGFPKLGVAELQWNPPETVGHLAGGLPSTL